MPLTARMRLCADPSVRVPLRFRDALAHRHVQRVDFERILSDEPGLQRQHLFLHADAGTSVGFGDAEQPVVGRNLHERVRAAPLEHHHLHVANLDALALRRGELVELQQERQRGRVAEEFAAGNGSHGDLLV